jgi:hypothetical protein
MYRSYFVIVNCNFCKIFKTVLTGSEFFEDPPSSLYHIIILVHRHQVFDLVYYR